ncbi:MAG: hypothetical protein KJ957_01010 [Candidatus Omnitrophica bacterium]|nr:hypothetical protein [Candidatus Omnitrophota bacterium]MBU1852607.1 hypothetical protein [Candidatus Omnitrophota bacterium]
MKNMTYEEMFIEVVRRVNTYLIILGVFFLVYFLFKTKVDIFLLLLALSNMAFALLSYKHLVITNSLATQLRSAKTALEDVTKDTRRMHPDQ